VRSVKRKKLKTRTAFVRSRPVQHKRKGHYRSGVYVQPTWVNKGVAGAGKLALFAGKAGLGFAMRKGEEAARKAAEKREADRKEKERLEEAGISKPKEGFVSKAVHIIPGTKAVEERSKNQAFQEAQKKAFEQKQEYGNRLEAKRKLNEVEPRQDSSSSLKRLALETKRI
jgi:hypothetical protein